MEFPFRDGDSRTAKAITTFDDCKRAWFTLVPTVEGDAALEGFYGNFYIIFLLDMLVGI